MTGYQTMRDYISYTQRPFTSHQIVKELGICYETVKKYLQGFQADGYVKMIGIDKGKKVYVYNRNYGKTEEYKPTQRHDTLSSIKKAYIRQLKKWREDFDDLL